jgi:ubiquitin C-terminal hydrolase
MAPFIPSKTFRETSLMECFKLYFKEETIDGQWECDKCKQRSSKTKRSVQISHTPNILILHLKRFTTRKQKLRDPVSYKTEMDIGMYRIINNRFCAPEVKETRYRLSSMIVHQGGLDSGHYFAMVKKQDKVTHNPLRLVVHLR